MITIRSRSNVERSGSTWMRLKRVVISTIMRVVGITITRAARWQRLTTSKVAKAMLTCSRGLTLQPQNLIPPPAIQLEVTLRCYNQAGSRKSSSPSPASDEEPTSNAGTVYLEWTYAQIL